MKHKAFRIISRVQALIGAGIFVLGGKFLFEFKHYTFLISELIGMSCGLLLMVLGWATAQRQKSVE